MWTGVQFSGNVPANSTRRWFTHSWPAGWQVVWNIVSTTPAPGAAQVEWTVEVERGSADHITYWLNITNLSSSAVDIEARYAVLN